VPTEKKPASEFDLIRAADFESIGMEFELTNTTTQTPFRKEFKIKLAQLQERGLLLEAPRKSCALGHSLLIRIDLPKSSRNEAVRFEGTGKVERVQTYEQGGDLISIALLQFDEAVWEALNRTLSARQEEIADYFAATRGYR
jgi:hypothetical protein